MALASIIGAQSEREGMNNNRNLIVMLGGAFKAPFGLAAQKRKIFRIGIMFRNTKPDAFLQVFMQELRRLGYDVSLPVFLQELFRNGYDASIQDSNVKRNPNRLSWAQQATGSLPVGITFVSDPVSSGLIARLAPPGSSITGRSDRKRDWAIKHLQFLTGRQSHKRRALRYLLQMSRKSIPSWIRFSKRRNTSA